MTDRAGVFLLGLRGSGKSSLGAALAELLEFDFVDTDELLAEQFGKPVGRVLEDLGEPAFRREERGLIERLAPELEQGNKVLALGGGTPEAPDVERRLEKLREVHNWVGVWLEVDVRELAQRIGPDGETERPRLVGRSLEEEIRILTARRAPLYERLSDLRFHNAKGDVEARVAELAELLRGLSRAD